jgi:hypothetical protein
MTERRRRKPITLRGLREGRTLRRKGVLGKKSGRISRVIRRRRIRRIRRYPKVMIKVQKMRRFSKAM